MKPTLAARVFWGALGVLTLALAFVGHGNLGHLLLAVLVCALVLPTTAGPWLLCRWLAKRASTPSQRTWFARIATLFLALFLCALCAPASCCAGRAITLYQVHAAKQWCERRAADIEAFAARHGDIPHDIPEIEEDSPRVNGHPTEFWSLDDDYAFTIEADWGESWSWSRSSPTWSYSDF